MAGAPPGEARPASTPSLTPSVRGVIIGVDVGSSGIRVGLFDLPDSLHQVIVRPDPGAGAPPDPELTWLAVASAIREVVPRAQRVRGVGLTAHLATVLVGLDGRPAARAMLWPDTSAWREARELGAELGQELASITGRQPSAEAAAARVRLLARTQPGVLRRTRWLLGLKDYLVLQLTGQPCTDPSSASYTQLFDVRQRSWSPWIARACGVPLAILPSIRPGTGLAGRVTPAAAALTGLDPGVPVAVGGPDGSTGALGIGAVRAGLTVDIAGTTDVLLHVTDRPADRASHGVVLNAYLLNGLWARGGPTGLTGGGLDWLAATLGHDSAVAAYQSLENCLDAADPGDLMIRMTLSGRRLPTWNTQLRGRIDGISGEHGPAHLLRAAEEGSAFEVRLGLDALRAAGTEVSSVILAGAPAVSPRSARLRANVWGVPVAAVEERHASLRGAILAASVASGCFADAQEAAAAMAQPLQQCQPDPAGMAVAEQRYRRWRTVMAL
jgi:xylulokinase